MGRDRLAAPRNHPQRVASILGSPPRQMVLELHSLICFTGKKKKKEEGANALTPG